MSSAAPADMAQSAAPGSYPVSACPSRPRKPPLPSGDDASVDHGPTAAPKKKPGKKKKTSKPKPLETDKDGAPPETDELDDEPPTPVVRDGGPASLASYRRRTGSDPLIQNAPKEPPTPAAAEKPETNGNGHIPTGATNGHPVPSPSETAAKLDAMSQEREALRAEVEQMRMQLETIQAAHSTEVTQLKTDLEESEAAKEQAETQYETLMGRVGQIKETLGDRLKRDKKELEEANGRIEELETAHEALQRGATALEGDAARLREELQEATRELTALRSRGHLSQQNWLKEKDDLTRAAAHLRRELESTSSAMGEWEVIAMEERAVHQSLSDKAGDLEEQLAAARDAHERAAADRDAQARALDGLQRALLEIQEARKRELREMVESSEAQLQALKRRAAEAETLAAEAETARAALATEAERTAPFEREVKEKNLLIGKLRHEAIILNDHLTKALKYIMKNKPEENVDRWVFLFLPFGGRGAWDHLADRRDHRSPDPAQTSRHQPLPPVPGAGSVGPEEVPDPAGHRRAAELERGAARAGRAGAARHRRPLAAAAVVALQPHPEHAVAQHRVLLRDHARLGPGVARRPVGRLPRAQRRGGLDRAQRQRLQRRPPRHPGLEGPWPGWACTLPWGKAAWRRVAFEARGGRRKREEGGGRGGGEATGEHPSATTASRAVGRAPPLFYYIIPAAFLRDYTDGNQGLRKPAGDVISSREVQGTKRGSSSLAPPHQDREEIQSSSIETPWLYLPLSIYDREIHSYAVLAPKTPLALYTEVAASSSSRNSISIAPTETPPSRTPPTDSAPPLLCVLPGPPPPPT